MQQSVPRTSLTPPQSPTIDVVRSVPPIIPNKHLEYCPTGPAPGSLQQTPTPPASPPSKHADLQALSRFCSASILTTIALETPIYSIDASTLAAAISALAGQLLPEPQAVFPWLHGLHAENQVQLAFFLARRKALRHTPSCLRGITIVKVGGDLTKSRLKGAIGEHELLEANRNQEGCFLNVDPRDGFSVRNFQIQTTKMAMVSDIVIYEDATARAGEAMKLAKKLAIAQSNWRSINNDGVDDVPYFNTFILSTPYEDVEKYHPELVVVDSEGRTTGRMMDFSQWERQEMCSMSKATEIAHNVWLGPTPDSMLCPPSENDPMFDVFIEANDLAQSPSTHYLERIGELSLSVPQHLEFPSSGSIIPQSNDKSALESLRVICEWIRTIANPNTAPVNSEDEDDDSDGDILMKPLSPRARRVLIHCTDGYTESTLLALVYYMYAEQIPAHEAWLRLHCKEKRDFFAYPSDVALLALLQPRLVPALPLTSKGRPQNQAEPLWLSRLDGSLPSRILPYMYLGNLTHANNPDLLRAMGIKRVLSVGEPASWSRSQIDSWGAKDLLFVDGVQDNGVDSLTKDFDRCLDFIGRGKADGSATLVHCRVGVSRSATICIAEVMSSMELSFPRAYCFVRARRLNVIIQPHLRFAYELLKWEEVCQQRRGEQVQRELEWATIAREIAAMNKPYVSR